MAATLTLDNPVFRAFAFYTVISIFKMIALSFLTGMNRIRKKAFSNPEDTSFFVNKDKKQTVDGDPDVERVRRNHLNDLENLPIFVLVGLLYVLINPSYTVALWHFRIFAFARIIHTISYQMLIPQPSRMVTHLSSLFCTISMGVQVILATM